MATNDDAGESGGPKFSLFWGVYGQVAAVLAAFSMLVFASHFFDIGLKGVIRDAFDWWVLNVRPLVGHPLHWLVQQLPEAWRFEVPDIVKDYFAVGIVSLLSFVRAIGAPVLFAGFSISPVWLLANVMAVWPLMLILPVYYLIQMLRGVENDNEVLGNLALYIMPLAYLGLIVAANAWLRM